MCVPGGPGTQEALTSDLPVWLREVSTRTPWMSSVCSGSLLLAAAGVLRGLTATSHYRVRHHLAPMGCEPVDERLVPHTGRGVVTAAGVSAGLDLGLWLAARLADEDPARAIQLWLEYAPQPPFTSGSVHTASTTVRELAAAMEFGARSNPAAVRS